MFFSRTLARGAPRAMARLSTPTIRHLSLSQHTASLPRISAIAGLRSQRTSAFSTSALRQGAAGEVDEELSAKLDSELQFEEEVKQNEQLPTSVRDFLENSPFEIEDTLGREQVKLTRTFGEEKITITFSIADLNYDPDLYDEDRALDDEDMDLDISQQLNKQGSAPDAGSSRQGQAEEAAGEEHDEDADLDEVAAPCRLNIVVEKPGKTGGALNIEATAQDGAIVVDSMNYFEDGSLAHAATPALLQARTDIYSGPPFGNLDEDLQILVERYLEERGVTQALAVFVPDYIDVKEQREYVNWLNNVKGFVDA